MQTVLSPSTVERGGTEVHEEATPSRLTTTLYDLIAAIQEVVGAEDDALVVTTVGHLLQSGRLTWRGQSRAPLYLLGRVAMGARQCVSPQAGAAWS
jgi:hypothetical protein